MDTTKSKPVRRHAKKAKISPELRALKKQAAATAAQELNTDITAAIKDLDEVIDRLALKHGKSLEVVQELLHLGGHVLKSRRAVGVNNAYAHCEARCDTIWEDDPTKNNIKAIVHAAQELGGYQGLSSEQQQLLVDQLVASREEENTGIVRRPMAQLQDARAVMERVRRELTNLHTRDGMEFILVSVRSSARHLSKTVTFLTPAGRAFLTSVTKVQPLTWVNQFEAFAINGIAGMINNHELRKDEMKGHIVETLRDQIATISGAKVRRLEFAHYEKKIVEKHGIVIDGWTSPEFVSPSHFKKIEQVEKLFNAVNSGACKARKLSDVELAERKQSNQARHALGEAVYGPTKERGVKRKAAGDGDEEGSDVAS
ncbi:hypothetical protein PILCRDRAFT_14526 [Piloderma croceum F 1598]|uniref:Uncharacterized protein n=1 Tax=Piloderma croceum (strain F 1598) TaxID=765440 RepID=A0A0C3EP64_PILCF|nr:hypothetical protein PILCRDRAFT_14525 [Piloderma croceum F 1598]KIM74381.1 hypothetical protein PILCRDRAFT_14526 [Piloderma croceum F 1598]